MAPSVPPGAAVQGRFSRRTRDDWQRGEDKLLAMKALAAQEIEPLVAKLGTGWQVDDGRLKKHYKFPDFVSALAFTNQIGALAEKAQHHPDIHLTWGKVDLEIWTHDVNGLSAQDFELAGAIDKVPI
jgi:4a-hydroxytetrahydrobiopterin dehydratase